MIAVKDHGVLFLFHALFDINAIGAARDFAKTLKRERYRVIIRPKEAGLVVYSNAREWI